QRWVFPFTTSTGPASTRDSTARSLTDNCSSMAWSAAAIGDSEYAFGSDAVPVQPVVQPPPTSVEFACKSGVSTRDELVRDQEVAGSNPVSPTGFPAGFEVILAP